MKKTFLLFAFLFSICAGSLWAQGWPTKYNGVMLQGFWWDSYTQTRWTNLERQADELSNFFSLVWLPQSANCGGGQSMGYNDLYWFNNYDSSFGNEKELRSLISTLKSKGTGTIADVVINHRKDLGNWVDFPKETYKGKTYQMFSTDICANDDGGKTKTWATAHGYSLSKTNDTGEDWDGFRDLDHTSKNVQENVHAYLDFLTNDLGYAGFRYDMVKGYAAKYTGLYNSTAKAEYSVGEYWDGNPTALKNWVDGTKVDGVIQSAAFDFATRYVARDVFNNNAWNKIATKGLAGMTGYGRYAVTFCENHDTQYRSATEQQDPLRKNIAAANAYILMINGTPCVFLKHWMDYKKEIKQLIDARKVAGITNDGSRYFAVSTAANYSAIRTTGNENCDVITAFGNGYAAPDGFTQIISGENYQVYMSNQAEQPWIDLPSGEYDGPQKVKLTALSANPDVTMFWWKENMKGNRIGEMQSAPASRAEAMQRETEITPPCVFKARLAYPGSGNSVTVTRYYTAPEAFDPYDITVYVNVDKVGWQNVNYWTWGGDDSHSPANKNWPGDRVTDYKTIDGKKWYAKNFTINSSTDFVNFVFSTGTGSPQTVDINNVTKDAFFEIQTVMDGSKYTVKDVTESLSGIDEITIDSPTRSTATYNLSGQKVNPNFKGIVVQKGRKYMNAK